MTDKTAIVAEDFPSAGQEPVAPPMNGEIALIEKALERVGISSLLNHGAASCVFTEGCCGVSQDHILAYTREIALHCAVALGAAPQPAAQVAGQEPVEYWDGEFSSDGGATLYEVPQVSAFGRKYRNSPLYAAPQPAVAAGWVSVMDRLPPPYTEVLIYPRPTAYCCEGEVDTQGQWHYDEYETGFGNHHIKCNVTHWMPLPPAPSTEGESNG